MNSHFPNNALRDRCKACRKPIMWAETEKGRRMPIDPQPASDGNIVLREQGILRPPLAIVHLSVPTGSSVRFKSHFATCPAASKFRKSKP